MKRLQEKQWLEQQVEMTKVVLPAGIQRVEDMAFYGCTALGAVRLPATVCGSLLASPKTVSRYDTIEKMKEG